MAAIAAHCSCLTGWLVQQLRGLRHSNGRPLVEVYGHDYVAAAPGAEDAGAGDGGIGEMGGEELGGSAGWGPVVSFNLLRADGSRVGCNEVREIQACRLVVSSNRNFWSLRPGVGCRLPLKTCFSSYPGCPLSAPVCLFFGTQPIGHTHVAFYTDVGVEGHLGWRLCGLVYGSGKRGVVKVGRLAALHGIILRTGCFCNPGACAKYLGLSGSFTPCNMASNTGDEMRENFEGGHVCWDDKDIVRGKPTGAVRISLGHVTTFHDVYTAVSERVGIHHAASLRSMHIADVRGTFSNAAAAIMRAHRSNARCLSKFKASHPTDCLVLPMT
eukprot:scaffold65555_cov36-Tisochrysis_lutea.AAC.2